MCSEEMNCYFGESRMILSAEVVSVGWLLRTSQLKAILESESPEALVPKCLD